MLYLVTPHRTMQWSDLPTSTRIHTVKEHNLDVDKLEWLPAEARADDTTVRLALRYGVASRSGLVVDGFTVSDHHQVARIASSLREVQASREKLAGQDALMEHLMPGWKENGRQLDADVDESTDRSIKERQDAVEKMIQATTADDTLVDHWASLGGSVPQPL